MPRQLGPRVKSRETLWETKINLRKSGGHEASPQSGLVYGLQAVFQQQKKTTWTNCTCASAAHRHPSLIPSCGGLPPSCLPRAARRKLERKGGFLLERNGHFAVSSRRAPRKEPLRPFDRRHFAMGDRGSSTSWTSASHSLRNWC